MCYSNVAMNLIFYLFYAFSAKFLGQKVKDSFISMAKKTTCNMLQQQSLDSTEVLAKMQESHPSTNNVMPKFVVEFDGINCFGL